MKKLSLFAALVWLLTQPMFSQAQDICSCPATDPKANAKCGPAPAKLDRSGFEKACSLLHFESNTVSVSDIVRNMDSSKSIKDTVNYMSCYRANKQQFCHFRTTLGPLIQLSSKSADLPFAVQACLFKRESQYKSDILSPAGALGYVQFMPVVIPDVNRIIQGSPSQWQANLDKATALWNQKNEELKLAKTNYNRALIIAKMNDAESAMRAAKALMEARKVWDSYWEGTSNPPKSVSFKDVQCPNLAFGMSATKQVFDLFLMKTIDVNEQADGTRTVGAMNVSDTSVFLAGAYNIGYSTFAKICGGSKTLDDCKKQFSPKSETYRHMVSIDNCSKKDSFEPMARENKKDCEAFKCAI